MRKKIILVFLIFLFCLIVNALVKGDVNSDGKVNSLDYIKVKKHIMNTTQLTNNELKNADINGDGKISALDYISIKNIILKNNTTISVTNIELNYSNINIFTGDSINLEAKIIPADATDTKITWTSSNTSIATVGNGVVKALKEGTATITAKTSNGKEVTCKITVKNNQFQVPLKNKNGSTLMAGDPYVIYYNGYYYYLATSGKNITISASKNLYDIGKPEKSATVWKNSKSNTLWAPELHHIGNRWYVYYTDYDNNQIKKVFVLQSKTTNPLGEYEYMGKVSDGVHDYHGIDGTVIEWKNELYYVYAGRPGTDPAELSLYIAHMKNPYTLDSARTMISQPEYSWEKKSKKINEGPQVLIKNGTLHIIYSANKASSQNYCLGMLTYKGSGSLLSKSSWVKSSQPLFQSGNGVYGPGHASFTTSPDGKEDWIVYHAYADNKTETLNNWIRTIRIQKFTWNGTTPVFGNPLATGSWQNVPSGSTP